jgi:hypothetical protein
LGKICNQPPRIKDGKVVRLLWWLSKWNVALTFQSATTRSHRCCRHRRLELSRREEETTGWRFRDSCTVTGSWRPSYLEEHCSPKLHLQELLGSVKFPGDTKLYTGAQLFPDSTNKSTPDQGEGSTERAQAIFRTCGRQQTPEQAQAEVLLATLERRFLRWCQRPESYAASWGSRKRNRVLNEITQWQDTACKDGRGLRQVKTAATVKPIVLDSRKETRCDCTNQLRPEGSR